MLVPCGACRRHVRNDEKCCPFCRVARVVVAVAIAFTGSTAHAEEVGSVVAIYGAPPTPRPNAVQADLGLGIVGLAYERAFGGRFALQVEGQVFGTWWGPSFDLPRFSGWGGQVRPTFFLTDDAQRGLYVAPFFRAHAVRATQDGITGRGFGWSAGVFAGWSWVLWRAWNVRVGGGVQYMHYRVDAGPARVTWIRPYPALDLVVGYTF